MPRPITLFTGQWADLPFETVCAKAKAFGYDGVEIACWGDHFEVDKALESGIYRATATISWSHGSVLMISTHLAGQCVCDRSTSAMPASSPSTADGKETVCARRRGNAHSPLREVQRKHRLLHRLAHLHMVYSFPPNPGDFLGKD